MKTATRLSLLLSIIVAGFGCTRMPVDYGNAGERPVMMKADNSELMQLVASARIGAAKTYIDPVSGLTSEITVLGEYFSANGRSCRRFAQHLSNAVAAEKKLGCKDQNNGWQEIQICLLYTSPSPRDRG